MAIEIRPVRGRYARSRFVDLPFRIFGADPAWVPPLRLSVHDRLSPRHPATEHQDTALWLAYRHGRPVGRIGACVDHLFNQFQSLSWAWVGFYESPDDPEVADALFAAAWDWARAKGVTTCVGPASFTTNDECGLLVDGFEHPPMILTPHNPPYYEGLWSGAGWRAAIDLWGWRLDRGAVAISERQRKVLARLRARADVSVRSARMDDFDAEVGRFFEVYNEAWTRNWGFAPMTEAEVRHLAKNLKQIVDPELALVVERGNGEPIAVALALPDVNEVMRKVRGGRLLPTGALRLWRGLPKVTRGRILALGVRPEAEPHALGPLLFEALLDRWTRRERITTAEASWVLATNKAMNAPIEAFGGRRYKTWRMYEKDL